jgi:hypothetical protein
MDWTSRIEPFALLGNLLKDFLYEKDRKTNPLFSELDNAIQQASLMNQWFTCEAIEHALLSWSVNLKKEAIERWLEPYTTLDSYSPACKNVAVIMAGNLPLVGFHDFLSVLLSGNRCIGRLSSDDQELLPALARILVHFNYKLKDYIMFTKERLTGFDAVIATGSNNSANYFNYYFSKVPHIIRKNRNGIAIITGDEDQQELSGLTDDIFLYFGLGCRNVSKLYVPEGYKFEPLLEAFQRYMNYSAHHKWMNNHDYYRSVFCLNQISVMDNGFVLLMENKAIASPPAVLYYEYYTNLDQLLDQLLLQKDEIQVTVCKKEIPLYSCLPGHAQAPGLSDYADGIDTMQFLLGLK